MRLTGRDQRITARLNEDETRVLDKACEILGADRSKVIRLALSNFFGQMVLYEAFKVD